MRHFMLFLACAGGLAVSPGAAAASFERFDQRAGSFVGARIHLPLGGSSKARPRAALTVAPAVTRKLAGAIVQTDIGEGVALNLGRKPTLTLSGVSADHAFGRTQKLSEGGWIAFGAGIVAIGAGVYVLHLVDEAEENSD